MHCRPIKLPRVDGIVDTQKVKPVFRKETNTMPKTSPQVQDLGLEELESHFIAKLQDHRSELEKRKDDLSQQLNAVQTELNRINQREAAITSPSPYRKPRTASRATNGRRRGSVSLKSAVQAILSEAKRPMKATEIAKEVKSRNVKVAVKADTMSNQIATILFKGNKQGEFEKVDHGLYQTVATAS